ncbi:hypothetical protein RI537_04665 [Aeromonas salmonicida]|uniref:hypothetical protein n=1 Tax=Aeromonas salmonicida TaxID=645 RepID=UPI003428DE8A
MSHASSRLRSSQPICPGSRRAAEFTYPRAWRYGACGDASPSDPADDARCYLSAVAAAPRTPREPAQPVMETIDWDELESDEERKEGGGDLPYSLVTAQWLRRPLG